MDWQRDAQANRKAWDGKSDGYQSAHGAQLGRNPLAWGVWSIPEDELGVLGDVAGKDILELGCGGAQWSIGLTNRGARCVGLDNSERQLHYARENQHDAGVSFELIHAAAESVPLPDAAFDIVFCDHGAMSFADPRRTVPEAARLLRPGGILAFSAGTPLHFLCWDDERDAVGTTLRANYFERHRWDDEGGVCFSLPYGQWIAVFRRSGFAIDALIELRPPLHVDSTYSAFVPHEWARTWPSTSGASFANETSQRSLTSGSVA